MLHPLANKAFREAHSKLRETATGEGDDRVSSFVPSPPPPPHPPHALLNPLCWLYSAGISPTY